MDTAATARIRALNDALRVHHRGGRIIITPGIQMLGAPIIAAIDTAISGLTGFGDGNDPYHERDFGSVEIEGHVVFFKIDYYDIDYRYASLDPGDPEVTRRVMTIMLAEEY